MVTQATQELAVDGDRNTGLHGRVSTPIAVLAGITKAFGPTLANERIDFSVSPGEIVGLVGGNGAGKSTFMRVLCGAIRPDAGTITLTGVQMDMAFYNAAAAQAGGIRMVHQELSLCVNLTVAENFYLEAPEAAAARPGWRTVYRTRARAALDAVFPDNGIDVDRPVGDLPIGQRQMVEIARAAAVPGLRLIILDEPTSSLGPERSRQLRAFVQASARSGLAFIFISHKLHELVDVASHVVVLRNGRVAWTGDVGNTSVDALVGMMGGRIGVVARQDGSPAATGGAVMVRIRGGMTEALGRDIELRAGEVVGLAGLEGSGQKDLLHAIFAPTGGRDAAVVPTGPASFVSGDRQREGVFPLWSVLDNIALGRIAKRSLAGIMSPKAERASALGPAARLRLDPARLGSDILTLSGGNQQKALMARALVGDEPTILLDDPTRGVDVGAKADFYGLIRAVAADDRLVVWHSTEDLEFLNCDRVLVFAQGRVVADLAGAALSEEAIVHASFAGGPAKAGGDADRSWSRLGATAFRFAPFLACLVVLGLMAAINPSAASAFGLDLLLGSAVALVLVALAQMFVIGGSEVDLGVGAFAGLVNVVSATWLYDAPALGVLALVVGLVAYGLLGAIIQARKIPAIVVTLGASFIWLGLGFTLQPTPGGASPDWLAALFTWSIPHVPTTLVLIVIAGIVAFILNRAPLGVALRAFGDNPAAMERSGWRTLPYAVVRYLIAGGFATVAGLSLTAINTASDINAGSSFTLLSVAAVVMGGCSLMGGRIAPLGVVAGAVTLALIGALLGTLSVSSDYNAAVQGALLLLLLILRPTTSRAEDA